MSKGCFTDKSHKPDEGDLRMALGASLAKWDMFTSGFAGVLRIKGEWKFYGINFGWALRYAKSGKSIVALYPDKDRFTVQVILNKDQTERALAGITDQDIIGKINKSEPVAEGKWIFLTVDGSTGTDSILKLVRIRLGVDSR